jgi:hypothetical protein
MTAYEVLSLFLEAYIAFMLTVEYFFGRSDMDMKNEAKKKRKMREKYNFERLCIGEMQ